MLHILLQNVGEAEVVAPCCALLRTAVALILRTEKHHPLLLNHTEVHRDGGGKLGLGC